MRYRYPDNILKSEVPGNPFGLWQKNGSSENYQVFKLIHLNTEYSFVLDVGNTANPVVALDTFSKA